MADHLFVELVPPFEASGASDTGILKLKYRDVDMELGVGFPAEVFRDILRVIREEL